MPVLISRGGGGGANSHNSRECIVFILILVSGPRVLSKFRNPLI